jgi:hypothetical protein
MSVICMHVEILLETDSLPILLVAEASFSQHEELRERMRGIMAAYLGILEKLAAEAGVGEDLRPPELALLLMGLPTALALRHRLLPDEELEGRIGHDVIPAYLDRLLGR